MSDKYFSANTLKKKYRSRIYVIILFIILILFSYTGYIFSLQLVKGGEFKNKARQVARRVLPIPAQRGEIYDVNKDYPLVINVDSFAISIIPAELTDENLLKVSNKLSSLLSMTPEAILKKIPDPYRYLYQPVEIRKGVDFNVITYIAEHIEDFPGVSWQSKPLRRYMETDSLVHLIGYVGDINTEELQVMYNLGYNINSVIGKSGIEKHYDKILRGENGKSYNIVDVRGREVQTTQLEDEPPENGKNIVLTIDRRIQKLCEEALGDRMGSVVVLRPSTGEIVAMVSYPWYNPNKFYQDEAEQNYREYALDPNHPFINRAIQASYAPASVFKVVMTTAAVEEEAIDLEKRINCSGSLWVGNREFKCHEPEGHGRLNLAQGLAESCDVYFYTLGLKYLGIDIISQYAKRFGLGEYTGIDVPNEVRGLVPTPVWKEQVHNSSWVGGDTVNTSIGQGYLSVTPIQMANMMAMVVNEGEVYKPHIVKEIIEPTNGRVIQSVEPELLRTSSIRRDTFRTVQEYLRGVITDGTAEVVITTEAVDVAGKTGTGEVGLEDRWNAWFAAYGPYGGPTEDQLVVVTMVEATNEWEWWAVRAANIIFQGIFANQDYDEAIEALRWGWLHNDRQ